MMDASCNHLAVSQEDMIQNGCEGPRLSYDHSYDLLHNQIVKQDDHECFAFLDYVVIFRAGHSIPVLFPPRKALSAMEIIPIETWHTIHHKPSKTSSSKDRQSVRRTKQPDLVY